MSSRVTPWPASVAVSDTLVTILVSEDGCDPRVAAVLWPNGDPLLPRARARAMELGEAIIANGVAQCSPEEQAEARADYTLAWLETDPHVLCVNTTYCGTEAVIIIAESPVER